MMEKHKTKVIYLRGSHDDFMDNILPFTFGDIFIVKDYILERDDKKNMVIHRDIFDSITTNLRWLALPLTALVETNYGKWKIIDYADWKEKYF